MNNNQTSTSPDHTQQILEKYDRESVTRNGLNKMTNHIIAVIAIIYSIFHLYITFNPMPELLQRSIHVAVGTALIFLIYPATKNLLAIRLASLIGCGRVLL